MIAQLDLAYIRARPWKVWPRMVAYALFEGRPLTTRGRWINPFVLAGYRALSLLPAPGLEPPPIFIVGTGRSGTTILGKILSLHPDVAYLNEPKALWHAALGDDDLIGTYTARPGRYRMSALDAGPATIKRLRRSYRTFRRLALARRVVDKYPELLFRTGLVDTVFPGARKVGIVRDGADTCLSVAAWSAAHGENDSDWWGRGSRKWQLLVDQLVRHDGFFAPALPHIVNLSRQEDRAAVEWMVTMREIMRLEAAHTDGFLQVRYEALTKQPAHTMRVLLAFCGLRDDEVTIEHARCVLAPRSPRGVISLHPAIVPLFRETMETMGYSGDRVRAYSADQP